MSWRGKSATKLVLSLAAEMIASVRAQPLSPLTDVNRQHCDMEKCIED